MFWVVLIIAVILFLFLRDMNKDKSDLRGISVGQKFSTIISLINREAFQGQGKITAIDIRECNLYKTGENQIIHFLYSTGNLTVIWKYKYYQQEVIHQKVFRDVRNLTELQQQSIARSMISEMRSIIKAHQWKITKLIHPVVLCPDGFPLSFTNESVVDMFEGMKEKDDPEMIIIDAQLVELLSRNYAVADNFLLALYLMERSNELDPAASKKAFCADIVRLMNTGIKSNKLPESELIRRASEADLILDAGRWRDY
jgi:hypothetical protein